MKTLQREDSTPTLEKRDSASQEDRELAFHWLGPAIATQISLSSMALSAQSTLKSLRGSSITASEDSFGRKQ